LVLLQVLGARQGAHLVSPARSVLPESGLPANTAVFRTGPVSRLIAGDSLAALTVGIAGLLKTVL